MAVLAGISDPIRFLDNAGDDWNVAIAVVDRAQQLQMERRRNELKVMIDGVGIAVGNRVAEAIGQMFR